MFRIITNDTVLYDAHTDLVWVNEMVRKLCEERVIFSLSDMTTGIHKTPDGIWELTPTSLMDLIEAGHESVESHPIFINGVPSGVREKSDPAALVEFMHLTTDQIARDAAYDSVEYGGIQNEQGGHC